MTIITASKLTDFGSSTTKSMLIVFYFVSGTSSGQSLLRSRYHAGLVYKQRLQVLTSRTTSNSERLILESFICPDI